MQTTFTVNLPYEDAAGLVGLAERYPALRPHAVHVVAVRVGVRALKADPTLLEKELRQLDEERRTARKGEVSP